MAKIEGRHVFTYTMQGVVPIEVVNAIPAGMTLDQYVDFLVRDSVMWKDGILRYLRGSSIRMETLTPDELAKRQGGLHLAH